MTIVELYDNFPINNIIGALCYRPEKIVFVGGLSEKHFRRQRIPVLRRFLTMKGLGDTELVYKQVRKDDLTDILRGLEEIYRECEDCLFNIEVTGGEDLILVGLGALCQRHPEIRLFQISSKLRSVRSFSLAEPGLKEILDVELGNTVLENLILHGGDIVDSNGTENFQEGWIFDEQFQRDLHKMWELCRSGVPNYDPPYSSVISLWNKVTTCIGALAGLCSEGVEENTIAVREKDYIKYANIYCDARSMDRYLERLEDLGLVRFRTENSIVYVEMEDDQVMACLTKSGTVLELMTYLGCRELLEGRGDVRTGVTIDWDWDDKNDRARQLAEDVNTMNELDIVATCGLTPIFISCKNGKFSSDELYKLNSVAERFGAGYCQKIIVTTDMEGSVSDQAELLRSRAEDMGIKIIENVHEMDHQEFLKALNQAMELGKLPVTN